MSSEKTSSPTYCTCSNPSVVSADERNWYCGNCGEAVPPEREPDSVLVTSSRKIRNRARQLETFDDFVAEFGPPATSMPRKSDDTDREVLAEQGLARQATWRHGKVQLVVRESVDGSIDFLVGW